MKAGLKNRLFKKILVPIVYGCESSSAIHAARAIGGADKVKLLGLVYVPEGESLSSAAVPAQEVRQMLRHFSTTEHLRSGPRVFAAHRPWEELIRIVEKEKP
ncbi:MAG: hypothetical protein M3Y68_13430, partial [Chloroflexota bacterium]|nr:hypothetical protein [Chloroflexota bacterium]